MRTLSEFFEMTLSQLSTINFTVRLLRLNLRTKWYLYLGIYVALT